MRAKQASSGSRVLAGHSNWRQCVLAGKLQVSAKLDRNKTRDKNRASRSATSTTPTRVTSFKVFSRLRGRVFAPREVSPARTQHSVFPRKLHISRLHRHGREGAAVWRDHFARSACRYREPSAREPGENEMGEIVAGHCLRRRTLL